MVGGFDGLASVVSFGTAQYIPRKMRIGALDRATRAISRTITELSVQGALGGAGEASAQLATEGKIKSGEVVAEIIGEFGTSPVDLVSASVLARQDHLAEQGKVVFDENLQRYVPETASKHDMAKATQMNAELIREKLNEAIAKQQAQQESSTAPEQRQQAADQTEGDALDKTIAGERAAADTDRATDIDGNPPTDGSPPGGPPVRTQVSVPPEEEREKLQKQNDEVVHSILQHGTAEDTFDITDLRAGGDKLIHVSEERIPHFSDFGSNPTVRTREEIEEAGRDAKRFIFKSSVDVSDMPVIADLGLWNPLELVEELHRVSDKISDANYEAYSQFVEQLANDKGISYSQIGETDHNRSRRLISEAAQNAGILAWMENPEAYLVHAQTDVMSLTEYAEWTKQTLDIIVQARELTTDEQNVLKEINRAYAYDTVQSFTMAWLKERGIDVFAYENTNPNEFSVMRPDEALSVGIINKDILVPIATVHNSAYEYESERAQGGYVELHPQDRYKVTVYDQNQVPNRAMRAHLADIAEMHAITPFVAIVTEDLQTGAKDIGYASLTDNNRLTITGLNQDHSLDTKANGTVSLSMTSTDGTPQGHLTAKVHNGTLRIEDSSEFAATLTGTQSSVLAFNVLLDVAEQAGLTLVSDSTVSAEAVRMYEALRQQGVQVEPHEKARAHNGNNGVYYTTGEAGVGVFRVSNINNKRITAKQVQELGASRADTKTIKNRKLKTQRIKDFLQTLTKSGAVGNVYVVNNQDELPENLKPKGHGAGAQAEAVVNATTGDVYFVLDNLDDVARTEQVVLHELVGHIGLRATFGKQMNPVLDSIWNRNKDKIRALADKYKGYSDYATNPDSRRKLTEEWIAQQAETITAKHGIGKQLVHVLQRILAAIGLGRWREAEVLDLLHRMKSTLETPGVHLSGKDIAAHNKDVAMASLLDHAATGARAWVENLTTNANKMYTLRGDVLYARKVYSPRAAIKATLQHAELGTETYLEFGVQPKVQAEYLKLQQTVREINQPSQTFTNDTYLDATEDMLSQENTRIFISKDQYSGFVLQNNKVVAHYGSRRDMPAMQALAEAEGAQQWGRQNIEKQRMRISHRVSLNKFLEHIVPVGGLRAASLAIQNEKYGNDFDLDGELGNKLHIILDPSAVRHQGQDPIYTDDWYSTYHPPTQRGHPLVLDKTPLVAWRNLVARALLDSYKMGVDYPPPNTAITQRAYESLYNRFVSEVKYNTQTTFDVLKDVARHMLKKYGGNMSVKEKHAAIQKATQMLIDSTFNQIYNSSDLYHNLHKYIEPHNETESQSMQRLSNYDEHDRINDDSVQLKRVLPEFVSLLLIAARKNIGKKYFKGRVRSEFLDRAQRIEEHLTQLHTDLKSKDMSDLQIDMAGFSYGHSWSTIWIMADVFEDHAITYPADLEEIRNKIFDYINEADAALAPFKIERFAGGPRHGQLTTDDRVAHELARTNIEQTEHLEYGAQTDARTRELEQGDYAQVMRPGSGAANTAAHGNVEPVLSTFQARDELAREAPRFRASERNRLLEAKPLHTLGFDKIIRIIGQENEITEIKSRSDAMELIENDDVELYELDPDVTPEQVLEAQNPEEALHSLKKEIDGDPVIPSQSTAARLLRMVGVGATLAHSRKETVADAVSRAKEASLAGGRQLQLHMLGRRQFAETLPPTLAPHMHEYLRLTDVASGRKNFLTSQRAGLAMRWRKFAQKNRHMNADLGRVMHTATLAGIDPAREYAPEKGDIDEATGKLTDIGRERKASYLALVDEFKQLSPEAQDIYRKARDAYAEGRDGIEKALFARIEKTGGEHAAGVIDKLRKQFESGRVKGPYFPLGRYGKFWVAVKHNEEVLAFSRFETQHDREKWIAQLNQIEGTQIIRGQKTKESYDMTNTVDPDFVAKVESVIQDETLRKEIWQMYLETLPEFSVRKQFMRRKGRLGFGVDILRNYANFAVHSSIQQARLEYGHERNAALAGFQKDVEAIANSEDTSIRKQDRWAADLYDELRERHTVEQEHANNPVAEAMTAAGFAWFLGGSVGAAAVNLTQLINVTYPRLVADFSIADASIELSRAIGTVFRGKMPGENWLDTLVNSIAKTEPELAKAVRENAEAGLFGNTQAMELAGMASTAALSSTNRLRHAATLWGSVFHASEVLIRMATFIAGFRLADKNNIPRTRALPPDPDQPGPKLLTNTEHEQQQAKEEYAAEVTYRTHFDYKQENRPRWMQNNISRVVSLFMFYSIQMMSLGVQTTKKAFVGATPEEKANARKFGAGMLAMYGLTAGITGLPTAIMWPIAQAMKFGFEEDEEEMWDFETELYSWFRDTFGETASKFIMEGAIDTFTPASISERVGANNLLFRDAYPLRTEEQKYDYTLLSLLGPWPSLVKNVTIKAPTAFKEGEFNRGVEYLMPKAIGDVAKAIRYAREGITTHHSKGLEIVPASDLNWKDITAQALGFMPSKAFFQNKENMQRKKLDKWLTDRKTEYTNMITRGIDTNNNTLINKGWNSLIALQVAYPYVDLEIKNVKSTIKRRIKDFYRARDGVVFSKNRYLIGDEIEIHDVKN